MFSIKAKNDLGELAANIRGKLKSQLQYATAVAITKTMATAAERERHELRDVFDRPTPYTMSSVYKTSATKANLRARVQLKDFSGKGIPASKYLAAQITGGKRSMKRFEKALRAAGVLPPDYYAVPGSGAQMDSYGNMKPSQIVQILSYFRAFPEAGYKANMADKGRARLAKGSKTKLGFSYFVGSPGRGKPEGVWQRVGFAHGSAVKPVLIFVHQAQYHATLDFEYVAQLAIKKNFQNELRKAWGEAKRTARR